MTPGGSQWHLGLGSSGKAHPSSRHWHRLLSQGVQYMLMMQKHHFEANYADRALSRFGYIV